MSLKRSTFFESAALSSYEDKKIPIRDARRNPPELFPGADHRQGALDHELMLNHFLIHSLGASRGLLVRMRCLRSPDPVVEPHNEKDCDAYAQAVDKPTVIDVISVNPRRRKYPNA